jgi:alkylation response protein AidB-like acyl-CoA dehydrogenase
MPYPDVPSREELVRRAGDLTPLIRKHVPWQEEHGVLHDETVEALTEAGLFMMRVPRRYGGYESDLATVCDVLAELSRADGAVGWTSSVWNVGVWLAGLFPDEVQDEIFSDPTVRVRGTVAPNGIAVPTEGGVTVNGRWRMNAGALHSTWDTHSAGLALEDGQFAPILLAVPTKELLLVDDGNTAGLRGTGSLTTIAEDLFVPAERVLHMLPVLTTGQHHSERDAGSTMWDVAFLPSASAVTAVPPGLARAARENFLERLPDRKISYTNHEHRADAALTRHQVATASVKIDQAEFHVRRGAERIDSKARSGEPWTLEDRALARMDMGAATELAKEAVEIFNTASGADALHWDMPMRRIMRDVEMVSLHAIMHPNTNTELYGRVLCGLEPNTLFL